MAQVIVAWFRKAVVIVTFAVLFLGVLTAVFNLLKLVYSVLPSFARPFVTFAGVVLFYQIVRGAVGSVE